MTRILYVSAVVLLAVAPLLAAHPGHDDGPVDEVFKVGKKGDVNIRHDLAAGGVLIKRGKYLFEHRVEGERHTIVLTGTGRKDGTEPRYEMPMRLISGGETVKRSAIFAKEAADHSLYLTIIEVAGEDVEHVPVAPLATAQ